MDMIEVMEAEDVEDFGRGNVRVSHIDDIYVLIYVDIYFRDNNCYFPGAGPTSSIP